MIRISLKDSNTTTPEVLADQSTTPISSASTSGQLRSRAVSPQPTKETVATPLPIAQPKTASSSSLELTSERETGSSDKIASEPFQDSTNAAAPQSVLKKPVRKRKHVSLSSSSLVPTPATILSIALPVFPVHPFPVPLPPLNLVSQPLPSPQVSPLKAPKESLSQYALVNNFKDFCETQGKGVNHRKVYYCVRGINKYYELLESGKSQEEAFNLAVPVTGRERYNKYDLQKHPENATNLSTKTILKECIDYLEKNPTMKKWIKDRSRSYERIKILPIKEKK